ncbi:hypothetical protein FAES_0642 [Fibrella aestuarina BUZ 2]|uniref:Uncharacterized protein n=1 Tax=Fibrella aestuarina BUZ 2 TaxID=1166018 RepID=I0K3F0_9BACT|nr:hypothetical protein FAES_0642 [Fibrella aestuarina BUZ 2]
MTALISVFVSKTKRSVFITQQLIKPLGGQPILRSLLLHSLRSLPESSTQLLIIGNFKRIY